MPPPSRRPFLATALATVLLALAPFGAPPARAQSARFSAEIVEIDHPARRLTLKSSMGRLTVRVAPEVALASFAVGDRVWITFGQDSGEPVVTSLERVGG